MYTARAARYRVGTHLILGGCRIPLVCELSAREIFTDGPVCLFWDHICGQSRGPWGTGTLFFFEKSRKKSISPPLENDAPLHGTSRNAIGCVVRRLFFEKSLVFGAFPRAPGVLGLWRFREIHSMRAVLSSFLPSCDHPKGRRFRRAAKVPSCDHPKG